MVFLLLPLFFYALLLLWISHHWFHGEAFEVVQTSPVTTVTVLIPFRNEAAHLPALIQSLGDQDFPPDCVRYLFINDHSTDGGCALLPSIPSFTLVDNQGNGKKAALLTGLTLAQGELIVTVDADCVVSPHWLTTIVNFYTQTHADLIICPVRLSPLNTLWDRMQAIEFQSLAASAAGAALGGMPIMCNGANLAFRRDLLATDADVFNAKYASGDDMFFLEYAKRQKATIAYLKNNAALVSTSPVAWKDFWLQRFRWTSKSGGYRDFTIVAVALIVLLTNVALLVLPFFSWSLFGLTFVVKALVDLLLLIFSARFFQTSSFLWLYVILLPFYPLYVLISAVAGLFVKRW